MKWKIKNVPNHQPVFVDASQITSVVMCHIYVPYIYIYMYIYTLYIYNLVIYVYIWYSYV